MEFIPFVSSIVLKDVVDNIASVLGDASLDVEQNQTQSDMEVLGVSNALIGVPNTLCYVDKLPGEDVAQKLTHSIVITTPAIAPTLPPMTKFLVEDPRAIFIKLVRHLCLSPGFLPFTSLINEPPHIHSDAAVDPTAVIEEGVTLGAGTYIGAGCVIKTGTHIGENVIVRENTVIGCDGIALYKTQAGDVMRFPHLAGVVIRDAVEIGAGTMIPRGVLTSTRIGARTVIGNLCNIGHGAVIGDDVWMSVGTLIGGNTHIGNKATLGLGVAVRDNLSIGTHASVGMGSVVVRDVPAEGSVFGNPAKRIPDVAAGPER